ncbi:MAG TPA: polysaccharide biosynthesis tyrosine autokinase [Caulobacterales bacterium]|nr:polysaccharide biosynthesis tyrosine autokinase [Caulobacterales bacterium]
MGDTGTRQFELSSAMVKEAPVMEEGGLSRLVDMFRRRLWVIALTAALVFLVVAFLTAAATKLYTATTDVQLDLSRRNMLTQVDAAAGIAPDAAAVDTEAQIMSSRTLVARVVDNLNLVDDPNFNRPAGASLADRVRGFFGASPAVSAIEKARQRSTEREKVIDKLVQRRTVKRVGLTYIMQISVTSESPAQAARLANSFAELYLTSQLENKYDTIARANEWLAHRLDVLRQEVQAKERAVEVYRAQNGLLSASGSTLTEQAISNLNLQLVGAKADLAERESRLRSIESALARGANADTAAEALGSAVIANLREKQADIARRKAEISAKYGPRHPEVKRVDEEGRDIENRIDQEVSRIVASLRNEVEIARNRVGSIQGSLGMQQTDLAANNVGAVKLRELERDAEASKTLYEGFLSRSKQIAEQGGAEQPDARIVSRASQPTAPSSPQTKLNLAIGLILGLALGALLAVLLEFFEQSLRSAQDVQDRLRVACLGALPYLDKRTRMVDMELVPPESYVLRRPLSAFGEALRGVRASLFFSSPDRPVRVLAVTSALPDEGKTTTALALARISALAGSKTIVVDCDLRRRSATHALGLDVEAGLTELLFGTARLEDVIQKDVGSGADILPLAQAEFTPRDLFNSTAMRELIEELRKRYEVVILDTAPVLPLADTRMLSPLADSVLIVVRWARTRHSAVRSAVEQLRAHGAEIGGVVLAGVNSSLMARLIDDRPDNYSELYQTYYVR